MPLNTQDIKDMVMRQPVSFGCGALCVVLALVVYFRKSIPDELEKQLVKVSETSALIEQNNTQAARIEEQVPAMEASLKTIESRMVYPAQLARNLQFFYKLAADAGVKMLTLRQEPQQEAGRGGKRGGSPAATTYSGVGFIVAVSGPHARVLNFLMSVENADYFYQLKSFGLQPDASGTAGPGSTQLNMNLQFLGWPSS